MNQSWMLALCCVVTMLIASGCESPQSAERLAQLEQQHQELLETLNTKQAQDELAALRIKNLDKSIALIEERLQDMARRLDGVARSPERLAAELDASMVYLNTVRNDLQTIRAETAGTIRLQNESIIQGRTIYALMMKREVETLTTRLTEMKTTLTELQRETPELASELRRATRVIAGEEDPNQPHDGRNPSPGLPGSSDPAGN